MRLSWSERWTREKHSQLQSIFLCIQIICVCTKTVSIRIGKQYPFSKWMKRTTTPHYKFTIQIIDFCIEANVDSKRLKCAHDESKWKKSIIVVFFADTKSR